MIFEELSLRIDFHEAWIDNTPMLLYMISCLRYKLDFVGYDCFCVLLLLEYLVKRCMLLILALSFS